jgi:formamidopyrimidine-DNA glycosylase
MPELPEVEVIRQDLARRVVGRRIRRVEITEPRLTRRRGTPRRVEMALAGHSVKALRRRGKCFVFNLGQDSLVIRLGMTGQLLWRQGDEDVRPDRHTHARFLFSGNNVLAYRDIRKFGEIFLLPTKDVERILSLGVEPLEASFTPEMLRRVCGSSSKIKPLLLDQAKIAGIGNIYADEALFRAGIRPTRRASSLRAEEVRALQRAIRAVLLAGIRHRGSSISDYRDADGQPGRFVPLHRVYRRHGKPCVRCGTPIRRIILGQRGTHFCPTCQR